MAKATRGGNAQFTYDFGIAIAQSTVDKVTRLTGATLTLASAFYALKTTATEYVNTLRSNTLRFGGVLSTLRAMEDAQNRLIKGQSYFSVDDQLAGMNRLMSVGVKVKENFDWVNKAAHATGKSFGEFSSAIQSGISGNMQSLVDMGLLTQRATRMFDKYTANTVQRQQAILNFVKNHKGLMNAIKNDFETIQDQTKRIGETWRAFLQSVMGKPNDPNSFYGQIVASLKMVATALARNMEQIKRYGFIIGQTLGWVIKQIGHFVVWVGKQVKRTLQSVWSVTDNFVEQTRSTLVWLEFWKVKVVSFFKTYSSEIKGILKLVLAYKALKYAFLIGGYAIASVLRYRRAILSVFLLQKKYIAMMGPALGNSFTRWLQSLAVFMPKWIRKIWVSVGKFIERSTFGGGFLRFFTRAGSLIVNLAKNIRVLWVTLNATNPIGWAILAITLLTTLYFKYEKFRNFVNLSFKTYIEYIKLLWNSLMWLYVQVRILLIKSGRFFMDNIWKPVSAFFSKATGWVSSMWNKFMDTRVGKWVKEWIVDPLRKVFDYIAGVWGTISGKLQSLYNWLKGANTDVANATQAAANKWGISAPTFGGDPNGTTPIGTSPNTPTAPNQPMGTNPIVDNRPVNNFSEGDTQSSSMSFNQGSIQIIVQKGENIDEAKLARKIEAVLNELSRTSKKRGGL